MKPKKGQKEKVIIDSELKSLIPEFLVGWQEEIMTMRRVVEKDDYKTIRKLGHDLKGFGRGCGFDTITEIGEGLEEAATATVPEVKAK